MGPKARENNWKCGSRLSPHIPIGRRYDYNSIHSESSPTRKYRNWVLHSNYMEFQIQLAPDPAPFRGEYIWLQFWTRTHGYCHQLLWRGICKWKSLPSSGEVASHHNWAAPRLDVQCLSRDVWKWGASKSIGMQSSLSFTLHSPLV